MATEVVVTRNYAFDLDVTGWGWIHLLYRELLRPVLPDLVAHPPRDNRALISTP